MTAHEKEIFIGLASQLKFHQRILGESLETNRLLCLVENLFQGEVAPHDRGISLPTLLRRHVFTVQLVKKSWPTKLLSLFLKKKTPVDFSFFEVEMSSDTASKNRITFSICSYSILPYECLAEIAINILGGATFLDYNAVIIDCKITYKEKAR